MTAPLVTAVRVEPRGAHEHVRIFVRRQFVGALVVGAGDGERLANVLSSARFFGTDRILADPPAYHRRMSIRVMARDWLDTETVHADRGAVGGIVLDLLDHIERLEERLEALDSERPTPLPSDPGWLVKDFHVLYRAARQLVKREPDARGNTPDSDYEDLDAQVDRLAPAFEECERIRRALDSERPTPRPPEIRRDSTP